MDTLSDDCGNTVELGQIVYDNTNETCVQLVREDRDTLRKINVKTGNDTALSVDEFKTECEASEYYQLSKSVVENPEQVIVTVMLSVLRGDHNVTEGYTTQEVQAAWNLSEVRPVELKGNV